MLRNLILSLLLLCQLAGFGQAPTIVAYRASTVGGQQIVFAVYSDGTRQRVASLPPDRPKARIGGFQKLTYAPEPKQTLNLEQFGTNKYFDPNFRFSVDFRPTFKSIAQMRAAGQSLFGNFQLFPSEMDQLSQGEGLIYATESGLHGYLEGVKYYEESLATVEQFYQNTVSGATKGYWTANIETSNEWWPGNNSDGPMPGFAPHAGYYATPRNPESWATAQNRTITLESTGETNVTLGQLAARGFSAWANEMTTRRTNRVRVMMQIAKRQNPSGLNAYGSSMYQGQPDINKAYGTGVFQDGSGNSVAFGQDANGFSTINGRTYKLNGDIYSDETLHLDYYYWFTYEVQSQQDYQEIWQQNQPGKTVYPYIWSRMTPKHVVADQMGHHQANDIRMQARSGIQNRPVLTMREILFEDNMAGYVTGDFTPKPEMARVPAGMNAGCLDFQDGGTTCDDIPKVWIPPYEMYSYYVCARWKFANRAGSGFHLWNAPGKYDFGSVTGMNFHIHTVMAAWQARHDMQIYERFLGGSTLVEQPEVQIAQTGAYSQYDAIQAYAYNDGVRGVQKPVFQIRYAPVTGGFRVLILGGEALQHGQERTHNVRYTLPGMAGPVTFAVKLRGPSAQVFEFIVPATDANQTYVASFGVQQGFEKAGYAGRVGVLPTN